MVYINSYNSIWTMDIYFQSKWWYQGQKLLSFFIFKITIEQENLYDKKNIRTLTFYNVTMYNERMINMQTLTLDLCLIKLDIVQGTRFIWKIVRRILLPKSLVVGK